MATHKQEHRPADDVTQRLDEVPPEGIEPDLTPAPGTQPGLPDTDRGAASAPAPSRSAADPEKGAAAQTPAAQSQTQGSQTQTLGSQTQTQGAQTQRQDDLGFDPESPDAADPQVDPIGAAQIPDDAPGMQVKKRVNDDQYPPYNKEKAPRVALDRAPYDALLSSRR